MTFIDRVNPVTPFLASVVYSIPLLTTIDVTSATVALVTSTVALLVAGVRPIQFLKRAWPMAIAAPLSALSMTLYAKPEGDILWSWWLARVSEGSLELGLGIGLRVLAIGVPTLTILFGIDPTRLADGLAQVLRLPAKFVVAALAGIRLVGVLRDDWMQLAAARRARGLGDGGALRRSAGMAFTLLVIAVRRGGRLATAMEARGFGGAERTWARPSTLSWRDTVVLGMAAVLSCGSVAVAVVTHSFRLVGT